MTMSAVALSSLRVNGHHMDPRSPRLWMGRVGTRLRIAMASSVTIVVVATVLSVVMVAAMTMVVSVSIRMLSMMVVSVVAMPMMAMVPRVVVGRAAVCRGATGRNSEQRAYEGGPDVMCVHRSELRRLSIVPMPMPMPMSMPVPIAVTMSMSVAVAVAAVRMRVAASVMTVGRCDYARAQHDAGDTGHGQGPNESVHRVLSFHVRCAVALFVLTRRHAGRRTCKR